MEVNPDALNWLDAHQGLATWAQGVFTFAAGLIAIGAAWIAYRGAKVQADVSEKIHRETVDNDRRALAAALWAELSDCRNLIALMIRNIGGASTIYAGSVIYTRPLNFEIYEANLGAIGILPSDEAWATVQTYKAIRRQQDELAAQTADLAGVMKTRSSEQVVADLRRLLPVIDITLSKLAAIAKLDPAITKLIEETFKKISAA